MVRQVHPTHSFGENPWLGFEHVTMTPMCRRLIDEALLTEAEKGWLNRYHNEVLEKTRTLLQGDERALAWLRRETRMI